MCSTCEYRVNSSTPVSLKPNKPKTFNAQFKRVKSPPVNILKGLDINRPEISYDGPKTIRDSSELLSEMSNYLVTQGKVLDLGCGPKDQAVAIEYLGHEYIGIDYSNLNADILADAHAIPFKSETFDCILSYAVLEHLHNPFIAISEIERLLKPGGLYIGAVSQGEPFHDSYFHHTSWGLLSLMSSISNFQIKKIWASGDTLASLSRMGRYPKVIKFTLSLIDKIHTTFPILAPKKVKWPEKQKKLDELHRAGSICFVIQKNK